MAAEIAGEDAMSAQTSAPARTEAAQRKPSDVIVRTYSVARNALHKRGGPIPLGDLLSIVVNAGVEVGGKNPAATLSARLSNSDEFTSHRGLGWWFANRPLPDEGRQVSLMDEAGEAPAKETSPASDTEPNNGGYDAPAMSQ